MTIDTDESILFARIAAGDQGAFRLFLEQHLPAVLAFSRRYLRDEAEAEDVTQEVFSRVWQHAARWREQGLSPRSWLYRIAYNLCIDVLRRRRITTDDLESLVSESSPEAVVTERESSRVLQQAIAGLPEQQRSALWLCVYQGLSNREAAAVLDVSVRALESLLARGRRGLRKVCTPED